MFVPITLYLRFPIVFCWLFWLKFTIKSVLKTCIWLTSVQLRVFILVRLVQSKVTSLSVQIRPNQGQEMLQLFSRHPKVFHVSIFIQRQFGDKMVVHAKLFSIFVYGVYPHSSSQATSVTNTVQGLSSGLQLTLGNSKGKLCNKIAQ